MTLTAQEIMKRLLRSLPSATLELEAFTRLTGVVVTKSVPTAAMECKYRPNLLINPDFVSQYCHSDEHLFLLVMHELMHVVLAHTNVFPRISTAQNIAFDAIINARLMRRFNSPVYQGFFDKIYRVDVFPEMLLRPPVGYPDAPIYPEGDFPEGTIRILKQLYPEKTNVCSMPFYEDILLVLREYARKNGIFFTPFLLGDHSPFDEMHEYYMDEMAKSLMDKFPDFFGKFGGFGGLTQDVLYPSRETSYEMQQIFSRVLQLYVNKVNLSYEQAKKRPKVLPSAKGVIMNPRDRLNPAKQRLGIDSVLWQQETEMLIRTREHEPKAFVYLDVSGSMVSFLPYLLQLLYPYIARKEAEVFQFSTIVEPLTSLDPHRFKVKTSGGTQIGCVLAHLENFYHKVSSVILVTDGYTNTPNSHYVERIQAKKLPICVVLPFDSPYQEDLKTIASQFVVLPQLR
jgi:hypothetical protein